jgi:hypothetical protein
MGHLFWLSDEAWGAIEPHLPTNQPGARRVVSDLRQRIKSGSLNVDVTDGTMLSYLSVAANNDPDSGIVSGGPRRGYWYDSGAKEPPEAKPVDEQKIAPDKGKPVTVVEKDLYPLMELWLEQKAYTSKDMSTVKSGGRWGNPI